MKKFIFIPIAFVGAGFAILFAGAATNLPSDMLVDLSLMTAGVVGLVLLAATR
jgi:hypothetical protein